MKTEFNSLIKFRYKGLMRVEEFIDEDGKFDRESYLAKGESLFL